MTKVEGFDWIYAVDSFGYYPPDTNLRIPIELFQQLLDHSPKEKWPDWWEEPFKQKASWTWMKAGTFYDLCGSSSKCPQFLLDALKKEKLRHGR